MNLELKRLHNKKQGLSNIEDELQTYLSQLFRDKNNMNTKPSEIRNNYNLYVKNFIILIKV